MFSVEEIKRKFDFSQDKESGKSRWLTISVVAAVFVLLALGTAIIWFEVSFQNKFYPGTKIGNINLSGLSKQEAFKLIGDRAEKISQGGIKVLYQNGEQKELQVLNIDSFSDPDLSQELVSFDVYKTVYDAYALGRGNNFFENLWQQGALLVGGRKVAVSYELDEAFLSKALRQQFSPLEKKEVNASPKIICDKLGCRAEVVPESNGLTFNYQEAIDSLKNDLAQLNDSQVRLSLIPSKPQISSGEASMALNDALEAASTSVAFIYGEKKWPLAQKDLVKMIEFQKNNGKVAAGISQEKFIGWLDKNVASQINVEAKNAVLEIKNGTISSLDTQQDGLEVDSLSVYQELNSKVIAKNKAFTVNLIVKTVKPEVAVGSINDLGIREILGVGQSNFSGSPTNRRKNIKNGASKLHGYLIKPDEEFSLINRLLPIDGTNGYVTELVIKGNKTTPEYGGGLCQVGTTMFRAAMAAGLPILERQNHSYSVTYYLENGLPGTDATIYDPKPDFRFKNDTGHYILIQSRIEGDILKFEFWGTKDGRQTERTKPKTWGLKNPAPTKYIETTDLPVGQKKCTESSHKGISASFDYIVTSTDGVMKKQTFTSVYKPWQAVCLIGVTAMTASSTEGVIIASTSTNSN